MREKGLTDRIYSKLLRLYPREFRGRFGDEMKQNFADLSREREVRSKWLRIAWLFGDAIFQATRENLAEMRRKSFMNILDPSPRTALVIATFLALPMAIILPTALFNIAPLNDHFQAQMQNTSGSGHAVAILLLAASMITLPLGGVIALTPAVKGARAGAGWLEYRSNLIFGTILLIVGLGLWAMLFLDRVSCAMGITTCD